MSDRPYDDGEGDDERPKAKGGFGRPQRKEAEKAQRDRGRSGGRGGQGGYRGRDDRGGHRGQSGRDDRGGYRGGRTEGGNDRGGYRGGSDRSERSNDRGGYRGNDRHDRGGQSNDRGGYRGGDRSGGGYRGGSDRNDRSNDRGGYRGGDRSGGYRGGSDRNDRGGYRGKDGGNDRGGNDRGGYRGKDGGNDRGGNDRGGYRGSDRGGYGNDRGGYRGGDRSSGGYRGGSDRSDRGGSDRGGYRGSDRGGSDRGGSDRGGYRGSDRGGNDRGGYRGNDRGGHERGGYRGNDRGGQSDRSGGGYRGRDERPDHKRDDRAPREERSQRHERGREHNRQAGEDPKRREKRSAPGRTDFRTERSTEYARQHGGDENAQIQDGEHRPQPRPRDEIRVCGENACRAVMEKRPDDVRRLWIRADLMHRFGLMLKDMAQRKLPYHEADDDELERVSESRHHEGVVLALHEPPLRWAQVVDELGENCLVVAADHVDNPHNLGAIVRSGAHFGVGTLVLAHPGKLSASARRVAEGGAEAVRTVTVRDFKRALEQMAERGIQIVAADQNAEMSIYDVDLTAPTCLLLGNERHGLDVKLRPLATHVVKVPGTGAVESLNVSATAASLLAETWRQRNAK